MVLFDLEKFKRVLENFARKLESCGEEKAAEAVRSIIKFLALYIQK